MNALQSILAYTGGIKAQKSAALRSVVKTGKGVTVVGKKLLKKR